MTVRQLIKTLQSYRLDDELEFNVSGHRYNPARDRRTQGSLQLSYGENEQGGSVLIIGNGK